MKRVVGISCLLVGLLVMTAPIYSQAKWLADASLAKIPASTLSGTINGDPFAFKHGTLHKTGYVGDGEIVFEHFTVRLRDDENFSLARFSVDFTVTVKKGENPDSKTFRRLPSNSPDESQPSLGDKYFRVPEFLSLRMEGPSEFPRIGKILSGPIPVSFSGVATFGSRKNGKLIVGIYLCFDDVEKSCVAGNAEIEIVTNEGEK